MSLVTLGTVDFEGFEVPGRVSFGGAQRLAVHKLIGGGRIVDVLGRDDAVIAWSGTLSGPSASARARLLDALRAAGSPQDLYWDAFCYSVLISELKLQYCNAWWIPYQLQCQVQADLSQALPPSVVSTAAAVISDVDAATELLDPSLSSSLANVAGLVAAGSNAAVQARSQVGSVQAVVEGSLASDGDLLAISDIGQLLSSTGNIARLTCARGYLARLDSNLGNWHD